MATPRKGGLEGEELAHLDPPTAAATAIARVLTRIKTDPAVGWYLGRGTSSFGLLTEAHAKLTGVELETIRENFSPRAPVNPAEPPELPKSLTASSFLETLEDVQRKLGRLIGELEDVEITAKVADLLQGYRIEARADFMAAVFHLRHLV